MLRVWAQPLVCTEEVFFLRYQKCWQLILVTRPVLFVLESLLLWGHAKRSGVLWGISPLPLFTLALLFLLIYCYPLPRADLFAFVQATIWSILCYPDGQNHPSHQTADIVTGSKSTLHQPGAFISRREEPQHWQPWPEKMFLFLASCSIFNKAGSDCWKPAR